MILKAKHNILSPEICSEINHKLKKPSKIARIRLRKHECKIPLAYQLEILCTLHSNTSLHLFLHSDRFYEVILAPHQQWDSRNQYQDLIESSISSPLFSVCIYKFIFERKAVLDGSVPSEILECRQDRLDALQVSSVVKILGRVFLTMGFCNDLNILFLCFLTH